MNFLDAISMNSLFPFLFITYSISLLVRFMGKSGQLGRGTMTSVVIASAIITLFPVSNLSFSDYMLSFNPVFSVGSIALMTILLADKLFCKKFLSDGQMKWFLVWNLVISLCLFSSSLGFIKIDLYQYGYRASVLFILLGFIATILLWMKSPLVYVFIAYIAAYNINLLYSVNMWDYITDGVLFITSAGLLINNSLRKHNQTQ